MNVRGYRKLPKDGRVFPMGKVGADAEVEYITTSTVGTGDLWNNPSIRTDIPFAYGRGFAVTLSDIACYKVSGYVAACGLLPMADPERLMFYIEPNKSTATVNVNLDWRAEVKQLGKIPLRSSEKSLLSVKTISATATSYTIVAPQGTQSVSLFPVNGTSYFALNPNGQNIGAKWYGYQIFERGGELLFDDIPVRVGTEGGLYDRINDKLWLSATSRKFGCGPDKEVQL